MKRIQAALLGLAMWVGVIALAFASLFVFDANAFWTIAGCAPLALFVALALLAKALDAAEGRRAVFKLDVVGSIRELRRNGWRIPQRGIAA